MGSGVIGFRVGNSRVSLVLSVFGLDDADVSSVAVFEVFPQQTFSKIPAGGTPNPDLDRSAGSRLTLLTFQLPQAKYFSKQKYTVDNLEPVVAKPHSPDNKAFAKDCRDTKIDRVYIGSCTGGKTEDFAAAARILQNQKASTCWKS